MPDFDAFLIDCFPEIYAECSGKMSRTEKENELLGRVTPAAIRVALIQTRHLERPQLDLLAGIPAQPATLHHISLEQSHFAELRPLLQDAPMEEVLEAYRAVVPEEFQQAIDEDSYEVDLIIEDTRNLGEADRLPYVVQLIEYVRCVLLEVDGGLAERLEGWLDTAYASLQLSGSRTRRQIEKRAARIPREVVLVLIAEPEEPGFNVRAFRVSGPRGLERWDALRVKSLCAEHVETIEQISAFLQVIIDEDLAPVRDSDLDELRIEIFLPTRSMNAAVDQWKIGLGPNEPVPLGCQFPVAIRSLERAFSQVPDWVAVQALWTRLWRRIHQPYWICDDLCDFNVRLQAALRKASRVILGTVPPDPKSIIEDLVTTGTPIAAWPRSSGCGKVDFERIFDASDDWCRSLYMERNQAVLERRPSEISLLFDDPNKRIPVLEMRRIRAPRRAG
jgi:hypothetical protein